MRILRLTQGGLFLLSAAGLAVHLHVSTDRVVDAEAPVVEEPAGLVPRALPSELAQGRVPIPGLPVEEVPPAEVLVVAPHAAIAAPPEEPDVPWMARFDADRWRSGRALFERHWSQPQGLGAPGFNADSCGTCHHDPVSGGAGSNDFNVVQFSDGADHYSTTTDGPRLQGLARMREVRQLIASTTDKPRSDLLASTFVQIQTPSLLGLGRIDRIPDTEILGREDPEDEDGDGVRGVAARVDVGGDQEIGRFGWKAQVPRLKDFVCMALAGETGLTVPDQGRGFGSASDEDSVLDPELSQPEFDDLVFFVETLPAPERLGEGPAPAVRSGESLFRTIGCATCHVPTLFASDGHPVQLYSDLLLHEVLAEPERKVQRRMRHRRNGLRPSHSEMPTVADPEGREVPPKGFRTPPLWGVGRTAPYLHDGRAESLHEAILMHSLEARRSREKYEGLRPSDREALVAFLNDL